MLKNPLRHRPPRHFGKNSNVCLGLDFAKGLGLGLDFAEAVDLPERLPFSLAAHCRCS